MMNLYKLKNVLFFSVIIGSVFHSLLDVFDTTDSQNKNIQPTFWPYTILERNIRKTFISHPKLSDIYYSKLLSVLTFCWKTTIY